MRDGRAVLRGNLIKGATTVLYLALVVTLTGCASSPQRTATVASGEYSFWPPPPNEPRVQFLRSYSMTSDVEPPRGGLDRAIFGEEVQALPIGKPYGVELWKGRLYVCDVTNPGVVILDLAERETRVMLARGGERMVQPTDIAIAADGMKYVIDRRIGRIFVFDAEDRHIATFGDEGLVPAGIAVKGDELFVPDFGTQTVLVLDRYRGETRRTIGRPGGEDGTFVRPVGVHVDQDGGVWVGDTISGRVQQFDTSGSLEMTLGQLTDTPGNFVRPKHLAVDSDGIVYVVDAAFQNVQMFDRDGKLLMFFGGAGQHPGAMSLPAGISVHDTGIEHFADLVHPAFAARRILVVTNQFGANKVAVYALGELRDGYSMNDITPSMATLTPPSTPAGRVQAGGEPVTGTAVPDGGVEDGTDR